VERRYGFFGETTDVKFEGIGAASEAADEFSAQNGSHARRKAAVGSESDAAILSFAGEREFLADYGVVSAQVGKVAARFDCSFRQAEVQKVGYGGERSVMAAHQRSSFLLTAGVERECADFLIADDLVYARRDLASTLEVTIRE